MKTDRYTFPAAVMGSHTAVVGKTGSGKTITAKDLVEQAHAEGASVCILDPIKSDWWGITLDADGKRPGLPFHILGGPVGHVELHADAGDALGRIVASGSLRHSIFDMAGFGPGDHNEFYNAFAEALFRNKTKASGPLYLVLEEAHVFCPKERDGVKGENMAVFWTKRIATAARSKAVRIIATTQRTQALHNAVLGSCETVIAHRMTFPADQKPVIDWLKASAPSQVVKEVSESLASLKTGEGWLCSGEAQVFERIKFPMIRTFDNSSSEAGDAVRPPPVDQAALRAIVGDAVKEAEANDPKKLKARIAELEKSLDELTGSVAVYADDKEAEAAGLLADAQAEVSRMHLRAVNLEAQLDQAQAAARTVAGAQLQLMALTREVRPIIEAVQGAADRLPDLLGRLEAFTSELTGAKFPDPEPTPPAAPPIVRFASEFAQAQRHTNGQAEARKQPPPRKQPAPAGANQPVASPPSSAVSPTRAALNGTQRRLLDACIAVHRVTRRWPERDMLGWWAGIRSQGGHFDNNVGPMITGGLMARADGGYQLTPAGVATADASAVQPGRVVEKIMGMLNGTQQRMLRVLLAKAGTMVPRDRVGELAEPPIKTQGGHFDNNMGPMVTGGLVVREQGGYRAADWLVRTGMR